MTLKVLMATAVAGSLTLAGCAENGGLDLISTGSIAPTGNAAASKVAAAPAIDPACVELTARIDQLRKEGTAERLAKVAEGKSKTAAIKRAALARMTELDKANQEFQYKCSTIGSSPQPVAATQAASAQKVAAAAQTAATASSTAKAAAETAEKAAVTAKSAAKVAKAASADAK